MAVADAKLGAELEGLDSLDLVAPRAQRGRRFARVVLPKLVATVAFFGAWQLLVLSGWKPEYVIPSPFTVLKAMTQNPRELLDAAAVTMVRGAIGFGCAIVIGGAVGLVVARLGLVRAAVGSMITGLQTMPSIAWYPLAIIVFGLGEYAILFVVIVGAAPSIANGIITGVDQVPPLLKRVGRTMGAKGLGHLRYVVLPAALPVMVSGLKQGWAFCWRSLLAGEIIVALSRVGLGEKLQDYKDFNDFVGLYEIMIVIFVLGVLVDGVLFGSADRAIRRRWGLAD